MIDEKTTADLKKVTTHREQSQPMLTFPAQAIAAVLPTFKLFLAAGKYVLGDDFLTTWPSISFAPDNLRGRTVDELEAEVYGNVVEYIVLYNGANGTNYRVLDSNWEDVSGTDLKFLHVYLNPPFVFRLGGGGR